MQYNPTAKPAAAEFAEVLQKEPRWYDLGKFIDAPTDALDYINMTYTNYGLLRCLLELHKCLEQRLMLPTWKTIAVALRSMGNDKLADTICPIKHKG